MRFPIIITASLALTAALAQTSEMPERPVSAPQPAATAQATPPAASTTAQAEPAPSASSGDNKDATVERPVVCFSARETSDQVARLRLFNPLIAMQTNARRLRADPLRTRLCRSAGRLVYELSLIRKDGKVLKIYLNAQTGRPLASPRN
jgi:hypothetical protein